MAPKPGSGPGNPSPIAAPLKEVYARLADTLDTMRFAPPVTHVYNPLRYAGAMHDAYLARYARTGKVVFLGMNPGPWGMAQTGIPFGEIAAVRDWLKLQLPIGRPAVEHPKREVQGLDCARAEVSGNRLWGYFAAMFPDANDFFDRAFVLNWCPLSFMEAGGANRTPDKLPKSERTPLFAACDAALGEVLAILAPTLVIGVGGFAEKRAAAAIALAGLSTPVGTVLHPSPASPRANRGWANEATGELRALGLEWPFPPTT